MVGVTDNLSAANDFTKREKTENLDGTNTESNGVGDSISLDGFSNLLWVLDSSLGLALEKLKDSLELSSRWRSQTFLDVDLLGKLANNLGPENSLGGSAAGSTDNAVNLTACAASGVVANRRTDHVGGLGGTEHLLSEHGEFVCEERYFR